MTDPILDAEGRESYLDESGQPQPIADEHYPNRAGKTAVDLGDHGTIHVPDGHTDQVVRYETPDGEKHEWVNPDGVAPAVKNPEPGADVIWDAGAGGYVPRVKVEATEAGTSGETATGG